MSSYTCTDDITNQGNFMEQSIIKLYDITKRSSSFEAFHSYMLSTLYNMLSFSLARHNYFVYIHYAYSNAFLFIKKKPLK